MHFKRLIAVAFAATMLLAAPAFAAAAPDILQLGRPEVTFDVCYAPATPMASIEIVEAPALCLASNGPIKIRAPNQVRLAHLVVLMDANGQPPLVSCSLARASPPI
ncbi:hypothetical protein PSC71_08355 [Devosia sp. J2-20]|uniref:hypothetical protein n=1 Tax=Devosia sp. J2-20 TaxID=3026161 RepID=UPI00249C8D50|nr:hypothetical protein [Devosia sp. J2-20]WDR00745.1 hypothetical protein PSC71_08355 [Devosia sp. J2-20]